MSAVAVWDGASLEVPGGRLYVVDPSPACVRRAGRRGVPREVRLALTMLAFGALLVVALSRLAPLGEALPPPRAEHEVTVGLSQSLDEVAKAELPSLETGEAVARIRVANNLDTTSVRPGQVLLIPALP